MYKVVTFLLLVICGVSVFAEEKLSSLYVTLLEKDPTHSMGVVWHSDQKSSRLFLKKGEQWEEKSVESFQIRDSKVYSHSVKLSDLEEGMLYTFKTGSSQTEYTFRTLSIEKVKLALGGDAYRHLAYYREVLKEMSYHDPDVIVVGGDIAYTINGGGWLKGSSWEISRWERFFSEWYKLARGKNNRLIPIVAVVGNHDVKKGENELFYSMFPLIKNSFRCYDFNKDFTLLVLDSGHLASVAGQQTDWLKNTLEKRRDVAIKVAAYHVGAYPAVYAFDKPRSVEIRKNWCPLFENFGVKLCFEHHNHAYKRTYPLKEGKRDSEGVVYIGDGAWGVDPRKPRAENRWYLEKAEKTHCFSVITMEDTQGVQVESFGIEGEAIDTPQRIHYGKPTSPLPLSTPSIWMKDAQEALARAQ